ncbi:MAG: GDP-mannose 4,6-dehydratase [Ignavibacteriales bacterium]|nr:GDP-mannose 4,6-dehydratase [Ignavibacteriales bacterium]
MKAMIFGSNGQDGHYLSKVLERENMNLLRISRKGDALQGDVGDYRFVEEQIKAFQPSHIFHLAASSTTQHHVLFENHRTICNGTLNILEAVRQFCPDAKVFLAGSAMQFKNNGQPINEETPFEGSSPYAVSRIHSVYSARYYREKYGLKVYVGYFFNHDSPLRTEQHVNQKIVNAVKRIHAGSGEKLELGNIDVRKEFNFAGDVVEAVWILVRQNTIFEAIIGSGKAYRIRDWVEYCFRKTGKDWRQYVVVQNGFIPEYDVLVSDPKLIKSLGWVQFQQLADVMMSDSKS